MRLIKQPAARGYILLETMFAAALLAVTLSVSVGMIGDARRNVSLASHRQTATTMAQAKCEEIAASLPTGIADQGTLLQIDNMPGFKWKWATADSSLAASSTPALTRSMKEVVCTVQYPARAGSPEDRVAVPNFDERAEATVRRLWVDPS